MIRKRSPLAAIVALALTAAACSSGSKDEPAAPTETTIASAPSVTGAPATRPAGTPTAAAAQPVTKIDVDSTAEQYFVLYLKPDLKEAREIPVSITMGQAGKTTVTDGKTQLPKEHYRVATFTIGQPGDIDSDGIDDITEFKARPTMEPLNPAKSIDAIDGTVMIPDKATWDTLSYQGKQVAIDTHLTDLEFVKFYLLDMNTNNPRVYFMNTNTHRAHGQFANKIGIQGGPGGGRVPVGGPPGGGVPGGGPGAGQPPGGGQQPGGAVPAPGGPGAQGGGGGQGGPASGTPIQAQMRGEMVFHPKALGPDGTPGLYRFEFEPNDSYTFTAVRLGYELLTTMMPFLENKMTYYPMPQLALPLYQREKAQYDAYRMKVVTETEVNGNADYASLNPAVGMGLLRVMTLEERPNPRDIVIYKALPNELPRVAGAITTVPQTPLSHVNLRAVQDKVPNAFIRNAIDDPTISPLVGRYVKFTVTATGFTIAPATFAEVEAHHAAARPTQAQVPERNLNVKSIAPLSKIGFDDWNAFGVKAANVATLGTFGLPTGTVPTGYAVPFYFYDEFMKANGFYDQVRKLLADPAFQTDANVQEQKLKELRDAIKAAAMPTWMMTQLSDMQKSYPAGTSIRCRSSTNNEDLPNFSGAGLYDSKTQKPEEGHISKCIKQIYASLWNFTAFTEREFFRIDHFATAMGVLTHPNFSDEKANGVAVSTDPVNNTPGAYYVNTQLGEDLVTNPNELSVPEELLLAADGTVQVVRRSNLVANNQLLMTDAQIKTLQSHLKLIHDKFVVLYGVKPGEKFAIEVEYKITTAGQVAIKQARPWVFN